MYKDLEKYMGRKVKVQTQRYGFEFLNEGTYFATGISKEMLANDDNVVKTILRVKITPDFKSTSNIWVAAEEVELI